MPIDGYRTVWYITRKKCTCEGTITQEGEIRKDANDRKISSEISADRTFISVGFVLMVAPASPSNTLGHNVLSVNTRNEYGIIYLINLLKLKIIQVIKIVASARDQSINHPIVICVAC